MIIIEGSVSIDRPVEEVFAFVTDPANDPKWRFDIIESAQVTPGPTQVGSRIRSVLKFMGRRETDVEVTGFEPGRLEEMRGRSGMPMGLLPRITYLFEHQNEGTRFTRRVEMQPKGALRIMGGVMGAMGRRYNDRHLKDLKEMLEG
ncbi:MAG TPA: SRPBCC family protein [Actinomycetota bacterium]|nr:SRPBCC family protein [Actinomycetota bacterium]